MDRTTWGTTEQAVAFYHQVSDPTARAILDFLIDHPDERFEGADLGTKLKLLGVDVACFGDHRGAGEGTRALVWHDDVGRAHKRLTVCAETGRVLGGLLVGDASDHAPLAAMAAGDLPTPDDPASLVAPAGAGGGVGVAAGNGGGGGLDPGDEAGEEVDRWE